MATDKEKKNWGQVARQGYDQYANETTAAGEQAANDLSAAGQQQVTDISAANQAYDDSLNEAQRQYRQRMDEGFTQFSDIINAENQRIADERARAEAENKATLQAARWTGATELAASVANLIGVGQFGASNQQYKSYSQDWMKKADQDLKYNRARLDNMRDRQRALQQHMIQLRMNDAGHAASMATQAAGAKHQGDVSLAGARYNAAAAPVNIRFKTAEKAAEAKAKGAATEATMGQRKDAQDAQIGLGYARLAQADKQFNATQADKGYTPSSDGKGWTYDASKDNRRTSGGSKKNPTGVTIDLLGYNKEGKNLPAESISVPDMETLHNTIFMNIDAVTDLSESQKNEIVNILEDDTKDADKKMKELKRYVVSSGQLRGLLRQEAVSTPSGRGGSSSILGELRGGLREDLNGGSGEEPQFDDKPVG